MYLEGSCICKPSLFILPGSSHNATITPIAKERVLTISKYNSDLKPILPTFFKSPILAIPKQTVKKIIGKVKALIILINHFAMGSNFRANAG